MKSLIMIILASLILSCGLPSPNSEKTERKHSSHIELDSICLMTRDSFLRMDSIEKRCQQIGLDSVLVEYYGTDIYDIKYSSGKMTISGGFVPPFEKQIFDIVTINSFISYIDAFFVTKNETVEIARKKTGDIIVAEYPRMFITIYMKNRNVKEVTVIVGNEMYDIEYNPLFLEFHKFVENIKQL